MKRTTTLNLTTNSKGLLKALSVPLAELEERMQANFVRLAQLGYELTEIHQDAFHWSRSEGLPVANREELIKNAMVVYGD
ncbi:hypothetical protein RU59_00002 [Enterobacter phage phiEap-1]|uniref:Uncharacterized protein n=1 Tax=Enterobacter phage phiEap-1 TaxID=1587520 RepID=A0A0K2FG90_9CAUD|nr:hypothetical protein RU59_00002 [Enterobacter phage phiEap-1]ALA45065.1 hypothetical protein RU59_00002 [Enterobacter phage phiEap-1]